MREVEEIIVEALSRYGLPPAAGRNLIQRARRKSGLGERPADWLRLLEGPLLDEIREIIPVFRVGGAYAEAIERVRALVQAGGGGGAAPPRASRPVRLDDARVRQQLLAEIARQEGTLGVALIQNGRAEMRFPGASPALPRLLFAAHQLIRRRREYRVGYLVVEQAQVFLRPLGEYVLAVVARRDANLGRLLSRLAELEAEGGRE